MPRQRLKRPMQQPVQMPQPNNVAVNKQRRMDVLLPDRNEDPDCHVIAQQKRNDGVPVIQNVQGAATPPNRSDSTIHLTDSITLSVRQPGNESTIYLFFVRLAFLQKCFYFSRTSPLLNSDAHFVFHSNSIEFTCIHKVRC